MNHNIADVIVARQKQAIARLQERFVYAPLFTVVYPRGGIKVIGQRVTAIPPFEDRYPIRDVVDHEGKINDPNIVEREDLFGQKNPKGDIVVRVGEPGPVVDNILAQYAHEGVIEVRSFAGEITFQTFETHRINEILFGDAATAAAVKGRLWELGSRAEADQSLPLASVLKAAADEILLAIDVAENQYRTEIEEVHGEMDRARAGNPDARATYNKREKAILKWLQITPRNEIPAVSFIPPIEPATAPVVAPVVDYEALGRGIGAGLAPAISALGEKIDRLTPAEGVKAKK